MQRLLLLGLGAALCALLATGCGGEAGGSGSDGSGGSESSGGSGGSGSSDSGGGGGGSDAAASTWTTPTFELGTNLEGKATPKDFVAWSEGQVAEVVKGPQGLWMVVVAFRTCGMYEPPLLLDASVATLDGSAKGTLKIGKQKLIPGGDGLAYYYNFWLVVQDPENAAGKQADLTLGVTDANGKTGTHTIRLALAGGPQN